jgi:tetratricopeptide (TPR) repeat protein
MGLAFRRLERRARAATDDGRNPAGALQLLREFAETHPGDEDGWTLLAKTLHGLGRDTEADQAATRGLDLLPFQHMPLWELLLDILVARGEFERADQLAGIERDADPDAAWPWERLAWIAWQRGDRAAWAERAEEAWVRLRDHSDLGMRRLAETYAASDHPEAFTRTTFLLDRAGVHASTEDGWRANLALGVLWEDLDDDLSGRYYDRAARYRHADPVELEGVLAGYLELFAPLKEGLDDDDLEAVEPTSMRPSTIPGHSPFGALTSDDEED